MRHTFLHCFAAVTGLYPARFYTSLNTTWKSSSVLQNTSNLRRWPREAYVDFTKYIIFIKLSEMLQYPSILVIRAYFRTLHPCVKAHHLYHNN